MPNQNTLKLLTLLAIILTTWTGLLVADGQTPAAQVRIKDFKFIPQEITIRAGESVKWTNVEKRQYHSVWFEQAGDPEPPYIFPDESTERAFEKPGSFPYRCGPHPEMTGTVHVK